MVSILLGKPLEQLWWAEEDGEAVAPLLLLQELPLQKQKILDELLRVLV